MKKQPKSDYCKITITHRGFDDPPQLAKQAKTEEEALDFFGSVRDEIKTFVLPSPEYLVKE